jgi:hypothetical protein
MQSGEETQRHKHPMQDLMSALQSCMAWQERYLGTRRQTFSNAKLPKGHLNGAAILSPATITIPTMPMTPLRIESTGMKVLNVPLAKVEAPHQIGSVDMTSTSMRRKQRGVSTKGSTRVMQGVVTAATLQLGQQFVQNQLDNQGGKVGRS